MCAFRDALVTSNQENIIQPEADIIYVTKTLGRYLHAQTKNLLRNFMKIFGKCVGYFLEIAKDFPENFQEDAETSSSIHVRQQIDDQNSTQI